jgi:hypothetical protein
MAGIGATSPFTRALTKVGSPHLCGPPLSRRYDLHPGKPPEGKLSGDDGDEGGQGFGEALEILGKTPVPLEKHAQLSGQVLAHDSVNRPVIAHSREQLAGNGAQGRVSYVAHNLDVGHSAAAITCSQLRRQPNC